MSPTGLSTLSLHDALPISVGAHARDLEDRRGSRGIRGARSRCRGGGVLRPYPDQAVPRGAGADRKSTRLNSSHTVISYAVFCLKKKNRRNGDAQGFADVWT